jgi:predicted ribosomally synthesized peptide with SipW-like signal peptide
MGKNKTTKIMLVTSLLTLFYCGTLFVGTTAAYFTDQVSTGSNMIQAGNLDLEVKLDGTKLVNNIKNDTSFWGTGVTHSIPVNVVVDKVVSTTDSAFWIDNEQSKEIDETGVEVESALSEEVETELINDDEQPQVCTFSDNKTLYLVNTGNVSLKYSVSIGSVNEAISISPSLSDGVLNVGESKSIHFDYTVTTAEDIASSIKITVLATQHTGESDDFGSDYDKDAPYPSK